MMDIVSILTDWTELRDLLLLYDLLVLYFGLRVLSVLTGIVIIVSLVNVVYKVISRFKRALYDTSYEEDISTFESATIQIGIEDRKRFLKQGFGYLCLVLVLIVTLCYSIVTTFIVAISLSILALYLVYKSIGFSIDFACRFRKVVMGVKF